MRSYFVLAVALVVPSCRSAPTSSSAAAEASATVPIVSSAPDAANDSVDASTDADGGWVEERFARTGIRNATMRCMNPPCPPVCIPPPCKPPRPPPTQPACEHCCQLANPLARVDLAFFVVSLHHDPQGPPPTDAEVKSAARSFAQIWPAFPEKLVILMPAGPMIGSSTISRTDAFRNELSAAYGYEFNYAVTGTPFCNLGALTQAIITGGNWPLQDDGCVTHHFPPEAVGGPGYDTYGDFMVKSSTQEVSFHVLAAQTPGGNVNTKLVGQLMYLTDEGKVPRGTEPTFVAGDFNWPEGVPDEIDTTLAAR